MLDNTLPRGLGERLLALRSFSLLAALPAADLALVARLSRERDFQAGQTLATEGEPVQAVQLLISGRADVSHGGTAVESIGPFETLGLLPIAAEMPHLVTAVASQPVQTLEIDADIVDEVLEDDFALFVRVLRLGAASARQGARARRVVRSTNENGPSYGASVLAELVGPMGAAHRLLVLRDTQLFRAAPVDGLAAFAKRLDLVRLPAGEVIEMAGASGELAVIVAGRAEVTAWDDDAHGARATARFTDPPLPSRMEGRGATARAKFDRREYGAVEAGAGDVLGALEALAVGPPPLLVRAQTDVHLLRGAASDLLDVIEDHHAMGRRLMAQLLALSLRR